MSGRTQSRFQQDDYVSFLGQDVLIVEVCRSSSVVGVFFYKIVAVHDQSLFDPPGYAWVNEDQLSSLPLCSGCPGGWCPGYSPI